MHSEHGCFRAQDFHRDLTQYQKTLPATTIAFYPKWHGKNLADSEYLPDSVPCHLHRQQCHQMPGRAATQSWQSVLLWLQVAPESDDNPRITLGGYFPDFTTTPDDNDIGRGNGHPWGSRYHGDGG